jgi:hypothetical protein
VLEDRNKYRVLLDSSWNDGRLHMQLRNLALPLLRLRLLAVAVAAITTISAPAPAQVTITGSTVVAGGTASQQFAGAWSSTTTYGINAIVTYGGASYMSLIPANLDNIPNSSPDWQRLLGGLANVIQVDSYTTPGTWQGAWSAVTNYATCSAVSYNGANYLSASASTGVTPSTVSPVWAYISTITVTAFVPTPADCAFAVATAYTQSTARSSVLQFGSGGVYDKCAPWELSAQTTATTSLEGTYYDSYHVSYTNLVQSCQIFEPEVVHLPDPSHASNVTLFIRNLAFDDVGLAEGELEVDGAINPLLQNLNFRDTQVGTYPALRIGSTAFTGGYTEQPWLYQIQVLSTIAGVLNITPANVTVNQSGGTVTGYTVNSGGAFYPAGSTVLFTGYSSTSNQPCTTMPSAPTVTVVSGVVTSIAPGTTPGSGCASTLYAQVVPPADSTNLVEFRNASDGHTYDMVISGQATQAGLYINNHGGNVFNKLHIVGGNGNVIPSGIYDSWGGNVFDDYNCDTINRYCVTLTSTNGDTFISEVKYWNSIGVPEFGAGNMNFGASTANVSITNGICNTGGLQSHGGYQEYVNPSGPISIVNFTQGSLINNEHCDGSGTVDNSLLNALYVGGTKIGNTAVSGGGALGYSGLPTVSSTVYVPVMGDTAGSTTQANVGWPAPSAAPISGLQAYSSAVPGSGNTLVVTLYDGATAEPITCTITAATNSCSDTIDTFTPAVGDLLTWKITPTGTVTITPNIQISAIWATPAAASTYYLSPVIGNSFQPMASTSGNIEGWAFIPPQNVTFSHIYLTSHVADGSGLYSAAIASANGTLVCHPTTGIAVPTAGTLMTNTCSEGSVTLLGGQPYVLLTTGTATTGVVTAASGSFTAGPFFSLNVTGCTSASGVISGTCSIALTPTVYTTGLPYFWLN